MRCDVGREARQGQGSEREADVETTSHAMGVTLTYGHARLHYRTSVQVTTHGDWSISASKIAVRIELEPQTSVDLGLRVTASAADGSPLPDDMIDREHAWQAWRDSFSRATSPNRTAELIVANNVRDFASFPLLEGGRDEWLALQAGMPLAARFRCKPAVINGVKHAWLVGH